MSRTYKDTPDRFLTKKQLRKGYHKTTHNCTEHDSPRFPTTDACNLEVSGKYKKKFEGCYHYYQTTGKARKSDRKYYEERVRRVKERTLSHKMRKEVNGGEELDDIAPDFTVRPLLRDYYG